MHMDLWRKNIQRAVGKRRSNFVLILRRHILNRLKIVAARLLRAYGVRMENSTQCQVCQCELQARETTRAASFSLFLIG